MIETRARVGEFDLHPGLLDLLTPVDKIAPHPDNARRGDLAAITESMRINGVYRPVFVQRSTGYIIAGNHTFAAMESTGATEVPVIFLDVDDTEAKRIMLADNRLADLGGYDTEALITSLEDLDELIGTGYTPDDLADLIMAAGRDVKSLEELAEEVGEPKDDDNWPIITIKVPREVKMQWDEYVQLCGDDPLAALTKLLLKV